MISFLLCLALLIIGYFVYGKIVEDVYKRQGLDQYRAQHESLVRIDLERYAARLEPVSYTHLDVYKRQAQGVPAAFAGGLVADGKDLDGAEVQQPDAVRFLQGSCVCVGNGQRQHKAQRQNCRRQQLCLPGGTCLLYTSLPKRTRRQF